MLLCMSQQVHKYARARKMLGVDGHKPEVCKNLDIPHQMSSMVHPRDIVIYNALPEELEVIVWRLDRRRCFIRMGGGELFLPAGFELQAKLVPPGTLWRPFRSLVLLIFVSVGFT